VGNVLDILVNYREAFAQGVYVTLTLAAIIWASGLVLGTLIGWLSNRYRKSVGTILSVLSFLGASIPVIVILFWAHYPLQSLMGLVIDPFLTAAYVLSLVNILAVAMIVRDALDHFPQQFVAAAKVSGLGARDTFRFIVMPIILRQVTPSILSSQVVMLQSTLFASMISVEEILRVSQRVNATEYKPIEIFTALALFFLAICVPLNGIALILRRRFGRDFSER
jgi:polar amino acid transport system permease protein